MKALSGMLDCDVFETEIFGFHAQQAIEKTLKAWLSIRGIKYRKIHSLNQLFSLLEQSGSDIPRQFYNLADFTPFAVEFRYGIQIDFDGELDRPDVLQQVTALVEHVENLLENAVE